MLYVYCPTDGYDILLNKRLRISRIEKFNDPFELRFSVNKKTAIDNIRKEYDENNDIIDDWQSILDSQRVIYDKGSVEDILKKFSYFQTKYLREYFNSEMEKWNKKLGVVCFSKLPDIIQMWAHYSDKHKGIVIGFDEDQIVNGNRKSLVKVVYKNEMVLLEVTGIPQNFPKYENEIVKVLKRKECNWKYEKEIRFYVRLGEMVADGNYYYDIKPSSITEVYLGLRSHETSKIIAKSISQRKEYSHLKKKIFKMHMHESTFKLLPKKL